MSSFNRVLLCGTLGHDVDLRTTKNGRAFCRMRLATNGPWNDEDGKPKTQWHSVHVFGKQAERTVERAQKGSQVWVEGRMETLEEASQEGQRSWRTWITAEKVSVLTRVLAKESDVAEDAAERNFLASTDAEAMEDLTT